MSQFSAFEFVHADFDDTMVAVMRFSELRATGKEQDSHTFARYPIRPAGVRGHEKEGYALITLGNGVIQVTSSEINQVASLEGQLRHAASQGTLPYPATVRPNAKLLKTPWRTQHYLLVTGSGGTPQGVTLAPQEGEKRLKRNKPIKALMF